MVFKTPDLLPRLPYDPPDSVSIFDFLFDEQYDRPSLTDAPSPFVEGLSGKEYSVLEVKERVELLARGLAEELKWEINSGRERDRAGGLFTVNTIDTLTVSWAIQRLAGISSPANAAYSADELAYQLKASGATVLFTCAPLLKTAVEAARIAGIAKERIYLIEVPEELLGGQKLPEGFTTVNELIERGKRSAIVPKLSFGRGQGARQIAFLCFSSGTSGLPKGVMISHRNVIANTLQLRAFESRRLEALRRKHGPKYHEVVLGLLPLSHIYALIAIAHSQVFQGAKVVILPKFEIKSYLQALQDYQVKTLYVVPPIMIAMLKNKKLCDQYRLHPEPFIWTGAAPLGKETAEEVVRLWPSWKLRQGYGMTETCTVASSTPHDDISLGSSGMLLPGYEARIVGEDGRDITDYDQAGELWMRSPSVTTLGYLDNLRATAETFVEGGWLRSGDKALFRKSPKGNEHLWIVDRMKELIKVKGHQVAPAELEAHLLTHPAVADTAVISVPDDRSGEVPKAFVVKAASVGLEDNERMLVREIQKHVEQHKSSYKWLKGGIEFIDAIPKSPSGKILRRMLKDREREKRKKEGPRL